MNHMNKSLYPLIAIGIWLGNVPAIARETQPSTPEAPPLASCHPEINSNQPQYIIGYGSLMQTESKRRTAPNVGENIPVMVSGFERGWFIHGPSYSPTTYLGAVLNRSAQMNAVIYRVFQSEELLATDEREDGYCRSLVEPRQLDMLDQSSVPQGQVWIYTVPEDAIATPENEFPIVQSYVDIVISGCLEIEENFTIENFAEMCVTTTTGWSEHWVNDRLYPRRPFIYQPRARAIDQVLQETIPQFLGSREIE
jgi:cation transport regulator ChaC